VLSLAEMRTCGCIGTANQKPTEIQEEIDVLYPDVEKGIVRVPANA